MIALVACAIAFCAGLVAADVPCAARAIKGQSVVCVCNATYCDTVTRLAPTEGQFVLYTTTESGKRFNKTTGTVEAYNSRKKYTTTITVNVTDQYQKIIGFGGAVTDSASLNWKNVSQAVQDQLINSYFSATGLEYNTLRVPIGGSDFSTRAYAYNALPEDDTKLTNFTLTADDYDYKIPMIKACKAAATADVRIVSTCWSPANWMKTNDAVTGFSRLKTEYYQTYADYHMKFLELYKKEDIDIWALTTTNEPFNGVVPLARFNSLGWTPSTMGQWIAENFGPTLRNSSFKDVKILSVDDQRYMVPIWFNWVVKDRPDVLNWIDGIAVHWYGDKFTPISVIDDVHKNHGDKFIINTEACEGSYPWELTKVKIGSWNRAVSYIQSMIEDTHHHMSGWVDWNLCLNAQGGPNWAGNYVDSPIIVYSEADEFIKQPMFYAMGHFSKFVPRDSVRVGLSVSGKDVDCIAFVTPKNTTVVVIYNGSSSKSVRVRFGSKQALVEAEANSITTLELTQTDASQ